MHTSASNNGKSLFICLTPLQILIANEIAQKEQDVEILVLALSDNNKYNYYYSKINFNKKYKYLPSTQGKFHTFLSVLKLKKQIHLHKYYKKVFLASIDNKYVHKILSSIKFNELYTFDDGTANIIMNSPYYTQKMSKFKSLLWRASGIKYNLQDVVNLSRQHYSIYQNQKNIINNVTFLNLFKFNNKLQHHFEHGEISFFLGQPITELDSTLNQNSIENFIKDKSINYYFKHPREKNVSITVNQITSDLIFEDYYLTFLQSHQKVIIYTFTSTAALNLISAPNVEIYLIHNEQVFKNFPDLISLFLQNGAILTKLIDDKTS